MRKPDIIFPSPEAGGILALKARRVYLFAGQARRGAMKGICLVALGLLAPAVCFAQTAADQQTSPTAVAPDATSATHPPSIAEPPHCHFTASHNAPACSETVLSFQIEPDGSVKNMTIVHSSGDTDLDRAMADCTLSRKYNPAMKDGQPIEVPWQVVIKWNKDACEGSPQN